MKIKKILTLVALTIILALSIFACAKKEENKAVDLQGIKKLAQYKGIEVEVNDLEVTDEEVDLRIDYILSSNEDFEEVTDRALLEGDYANFDYEGKKDGVAFEGGTATGAELQIGSGRFIPGFEDGMIGMNIGEVRDINLRFPEQYHSKELADQEVVFTVKLNSFKVGKKAVLNEEFIDRMTFGEIKTIPEYRESIREEIRVQREADNKYQMWESALRKIVEETEFDIPEAEIEEEVQKQIESFKEIATQYDMKYEEFVEMNGIGEENFKEIALINLQIKYVIEAIFKLENLKVDDSYYKKISDEYGIDIEILKNNHQAEVEREFVKEFIIDNAKLTKIKPDPQADLNEENVKGD